MSRTRKRFLERKKAKREQRRIEAHLDKHSFFCMGPNKRRSQHEDDNRTTCGWRVTFRKKYQGSLASCLKCSQVFAYDGNPPHGKWMRLEVYEAKLAAGEIIEAGDWDVEPKPIGLEQKPMIRKPPKAAGEHLRSCRNKSFPLLGLKPTACSDGRLMWYAKGKRGARHTCFPAGVLESMGRRSGEVRKAQANT